jgi:putative sugar O-methyltransferase
LTDPIIKEAFNHLNTANALPLPSGFITSPWWETKQRQLIEHASEFNTIDDCMNFAQNPNISGFDHRLLTIDFNAADIIIKKFEQIQIAFPDFNLEKTRLCDSCFSIPSSLFPWKGRQISTIFFWHLYHYLSITKWLCPRPSTILEIGGGYGALARLFKLEHTDIQYTIVDIPESLLFSEIFLRKNFPNCKTRFVDNQNETFDEKEYDFIFIPIHLSNTIMNKSFDVAVNTASLQEMPDRTVDYWMNFIQNDNISAFYSVNYFLNSIKTYEPDPENSNFLCPKLDPYWTIVNWQIEPPALTIDTVRRWLEISCKREPLKIRNNIDKKVAAKLFLLDSQSYGRGSIQWLMSLWKAAWLDPQVEILWPLFEYTMELGVRESIAYGRMLNGFIDKLTDEQRFRRSEYMASVNL